MFSPAVLSAAAALLCQFSAPLCTELSTVHVVAVQQSDWHGSPDVVPNAWYDASTRTVNLVQQSRNNPLLTDADEVALAESHELVHAQQFDRGMTYVGSTCATMEAEGYRSQAQFWSWLWYGNTPHIGFNALESYSNQIVSQGEVATNAIAAYGCSHVFK